MIALALLAATPLTCGAVPRPGIAVLGPDGVWHGRAVDACRRAAGRLAGGRFRFRAYRTPAAIRDSVDDDIAFLSAAERTASTAPRTIAAAGIARSIQILVGRPEAMTEERPVLCFVIGSAAEDALADWADATRHPIVPLGFQEPDEMADGLASGKCRAVAIDAADRDPRDPIVATLVSLPIDAVVAARAATVVATALK